MQDTTSDQTTSRERPPWSCFGGSLSSEGMRLRVVTATDAAWDVFVAISLDENGLHAEVENVVRVTA